MKNALDLLSILVASTVHFLSGYALVGIGRSLARLFAETNSELPLISAATVSYTATSAPIVVGIVIGLVTLVGLGLLLRSERVRWLLPLLLTLSFVVAILQIMFVLFGVAVPFFRITYTMSE